MGCFFDAKEQKTDTTITPTVDHSKVVSGVEQAQKETKSLWKRFTDNIVGSNLIRMSIQRVTQAVGEAISTVKELDTIKGNLQMASGASNADVDAMISSYNALAKKLSSTTRDVAATADEFLRMGGTIRDTDKLIKSSQILSKVGRIDSADSAAYLLSAIKGYQVAAEDSIAVVDKLANVSLKASASSGELAEALSKCAGTANDSRVSMDRLIGYTAAIGGATEKSMSEVGDSFQSLLGRLNNIRLGRLNDDETGESLSGVETALDKLGIRLRDTENLYRSLDDMLDDIGSRWDILTQTEQEALSDMIAGTRRGEDFEALMNHWGDALSYSEAAADSAGTALARYGVYQDSIEAKANELTTALEALSTNTIEEGLYSGILEATAGIV